MPDRTIPYRSRMSIVSNSNGFTRHVPLGSIRGPGSLVVKHSGKQIPISHIFIPPELRRVSKDYRAGDIKWVPGYRYVNRVGVVRQSKARCPMQLLNGFRASHRRSRSQTLLNQSCRDGDICPAPVNHGGLDARTGTGI